MNVRKVLLLMICLMAAMLMTACYTDADPWPVSDGASQTQAATDAPAATNAPAPQNEAQSAEPTDEPVAQPDGESTAPTEDPGLNG